MGNNTRPTNVLIVGVGGQGVIMVSKVLAQLCQNHGYEVKQSEVHGILTPDEAYDRKTEPTSLAA